MPYAPTRGAIFTTDDLHPEEHHDRDRPDDQASTTARLLAMDAVERVTAVLAQEVNRVRVDVGVP